MKSTYIKINRRISRKREREKEREGGRGRRQEKAARNLCLRNIGGCVEHLKHSGCSDWPPSGTLYRVGHMRLATSIRETTGYYHRRCIILSLSCTFLPSGDSGGCNPSSLRRLLVRSVLLFLVFSPRLSLSRPRPGSLACLSSPSPCSSPFNPFPSSSFSYLSWYLYLVLLLIENLSFKFSHIFALSIYFCLLFELSSLYFILIYLLISYSLLFRENTMCHFFYLLSIFFREK